MLELNDLMLLLGFCSVFTFFFSVIVALCLRWIMDRELFRRLASCEMTVKNSKMQDVKADKQGRMNLALLRIKELHDAKTPEWDIAKTVAVEYPDVAIPALQKAMELAKQMQLGGFDG